PRDGTHPPGRARARRALRRLRAAAPAARAEADLARVAGTALPRARRARDEPGPADARRPGLRQRLRHPHARRRPLRATAPATLPQGPRPPRLHRPPAPRHHQVRTSPQTLAPARALLATDSTDEKRIGFVAILQIAAKPIAFESFSICGICG